MFCFYRVAANTGVNNTSLRFHIHDMVVNICIEDILIGVCFAICDINISKNHGRDIMIDPHTIDWPILAHTCHYWPWLKPHLTKLSGEMAPPNIGASLEHLL